MIRAISLGLLLSATSVFAQYKTGPAGPPPAELAASVSGLLQKDGLKISGADGKVLCEIWLRILMPSGAKTAEDNVSIQTIPPGALMGAISFPAKHADRRGQQVKAGLYTMRFNIFPQNGDHQGVAPQRDFLILSPAAEDKDGTVISGFDALMTMSRKASGTPHPLVFSMWKDEADAKPGVDKQGENDWVLHVKIGDVPVAIILVGKSEG